MPAGTLFTQEESNWIKKNYPKAKDITKFVIAFNKKFNANRTKNSIILKANALGVQSNRYYSKQEIEWIRENYPKLPPRESYTKFCEKFGKGRTMDSFVEQATMKLKLTREKGKSFRKGNHIVNQKRKELNLNDDYILSNLGNGEYLPMKKNIHQKLRDKYRKMLGQGDITKAAYEIELVKEEMKKIYDTSLQPRTR